MREPQAKSQRIEEADPILPVRDAGGDSTAPPTFTHASSIGEAFSKPRSQPVRSYGMDGPPGRQEWLRAKGRQDETLYRTAGMLTLQTSSFASNDATSSSTGVLSQPTPFRSLPAPSLSVPGTVDESRMIEDDKSDKY